ncbi:MAG TPA: hypothetical protein VLW26_06290 [Steroidobacteraceae bacterium]|nr:hypothetical protein [Steroidobacteraceae bacterium]
MHIRRPSTAIFWLLGALACGRVWATDWEVSLDTRLVSADGEKSYLDGGMGILRYGSDRSGVQLGRARVAISQDLGQILVLKLDASAWGEHDKNPVDLTEAYFELRPYPRSGWRVRLKGGAFYAPISLENRTEGWESPYTLSSSALDSWVAEELRTIGLEAKVDWMGTRLGHDFDVGLAAAVFGWNEPAGVELATSGFNITDWQSSLFGRVGPYGAAPFGAVREYQQIDSHAGYYVGANLKYLDRLTVQALHYDNRADPTAENEITGVYAWKTKFDTAGLRFEDDSGWTAIVQWLGGETSVWPDDVGLLKWDFSTRYALLSKRLGRNTLSARYDNFDVTPSAPGSSGDQSGHAWTLAYRFELDKHWRLTLEWVNARSTQSNRAIFFGEAPFATQNQLQLAIRYAIGSR